MPHDKERRLKYFSDPLRLFLYLLSEQKHILKNITRQVHKDIYVFHWYIVHISKKLRTI